MPIINVMLGGKTHYNEGGPYVVGGELSTMDTDLLEKREHVIDNDNEHTVVTEYWLDGELVSRGAHVHLKKGLGSYGIQAEF